MNRILVIEDEKNLARFIELELQHESYSVTLAHDGLKGLQLALDEAWDLILLDLMLPGLNGLELCRRIRKVKQTPVIMITARDGLSDKINGLDSGADDYIPKPFAIEELLARMRSLLRRSGSLNEGRMLQCHDLELDIEGRTLKKSNEIIELTKREFEILMVLMENIGRVMTREMLMESVWGYDSEVDMKVVDVYISYIRSKIDEPGQPSVVQTLRGLGYVIRK
ncbi:response regulator transcription factor [Paenibacillus sp. 19GGS1-52]|uniref:response regulator transcription factor n=1 Tax=Paenibacillus sp. 19GGS1-52 TaxID=2758563 RepID=UPI001EFAAEF6|nr:response regulator transcription factor [Paenibacillus sp. 19GGS1-52]ULO04687.1 response regulator transcription factor [Paenibacillus sp. 19GGS1-52]